MGLINNIGNETTMLWQNITKAFTSTMPDTDPKVGDNVTSTYNSV